MPTLKWLGEHIDTIFIRNDEARCVNCRHFHQHYIKNNGYLRNDMSPISWGHCSRARLKDRNAADTCPHFEPRQ